MRIAVLCPVHRRPDLILEQIKNYLNFGGEEFLHILHPSQEGRSKFSGIGDELSNLADVHLCDESWSTSWSCAMAAYLSCTKKLESFDDFDYVYLHTDADLLIKKGGNLCKDFLRSSRPNTAVFSYLRCLYLIS